jgi:adenylate cyclase
MPEGRARRRLAAILAADVAGYSRLMRSDEIGTVAALREISAECIKPVVGAHGGRVVKMMGDGALIEFASVVDAVECAIDFQAVMAEYNRQRPGKEPIQFRIGVNLGDVVTDREDIFGDGVIVAVRLEGQAPTNGILLSDAVYAQIKGKVVADFTEAGNLTLKNIAEPVRAWRWVGKGMQAPALTRATASHLELPSIAVLPFANMSGDPEQDFFADGLVEDIITTLSKLSGLLVIARHSSFVYKGRSIDVRTVATELGVRYLLDGSVRRSASRIRITAQLIDAKAGTHLWAQRYDRTVDNIFAIQDEITLMLATEMQVNLTEGEQARLRYLTTSNVEAWNCWVQGLSYFRQAVTREQVGAARPCWERALALDPTSATLNAMLGFVHYCDARFGWWDDRETALGRAHAYADKALELDPENADAHITTSVVLMMRGRYDEAVSHARRAVRLAPGSADVATFACFVLAFRFPQEAVMQGERAMALSPHSPAYYLGHLGNAYRLSGRTEDAVAAFKAYDSRNPGFGLADLVIAYQQSGRLEEARQAADRLMAARHGFTVASWANTQFHRDPAQLVGEIEALHAAGLPAA